MQHAVGVGPLPRAVWLAVILGISTSNCGTSDTNGEDGRGGSSPAGGAASEAGASGSSPAGAPGGGAGGSSALGGSDGSSKGGTSGGAASGGSSAVAGQGGNLPGAGGQPGGDGGKASSGGQTGSGAGGANASGGSTGSGGFASVGGGGNSSGGNGQGGGAGASCGPLVAATRPISFGTLLDAQAVMCTSQALAKSLANPSASGWRAKGDQHRKYRFADANTDEPYRLYVPTNWDGKSELPLAMFLHGNGNDENSYVDANNKQMLTLAQQHGYLLVSPMGVQSAYGNFLRLQAPFGKPDEAAKLMSAVTADTERANELSERAVIQVLELVLAEYPVDRGAMFLFGHSMGSGGTWYIGGKYASYWTALAPMSGPFVQETGYPWDGLRDTPIFVTEGTKAPSLNDSHVLRDWLKAKGFRSEYEEVNADHPGMVQPVLPNIFDFFDRSRKR